MADIHAKQSGAQAPAARTAIERLLRPRSVAIVGASATPGSLGAGVLANLERFKFGGDIHLVNTNRQEIDGRPCFASAAALPLGIDCAVLAIPRAGILDTIASCGARGVGGAVIYTAGFAEAGPEGRALQDELADIARRRGMAVAGPNCLGFVNYIDGVPLTFGSAAPSPLSGRLGLGIVSQSGAMASVLRAALQARDIAISYSISTGNEALNGIEDFLEYLIADESTRVIAMLAEQVRHPKRFLELARRARDAEKSTVLLHPGRSAAARTSAETHTGALSGDHDVMRALVANAGVAVVDTLEELIDVAELMLRWPALPSGGPAIITESGAFKGLALDAAQDMGLDLPEPAPTTKFVLGTVAPDLIQPTNPLDITAQALVDPELYRKTMKPLLDDPRYGSLMLAIILSGPELARRKMQPIMEALAQLRPAKPVVFAMLGEEAEVPPEIVANLRNMGIPFFRSPERALRALARVTEHATRRPAPVVEPTAQGGVERLPAGAIPEHAAKKLLGDLGLPIPEGEFVTDLQGAREAAMRIGYPVALKAQSVELSHKSDAGGVVLGLTDDDSLARGWQRLHSTLSRTRPELKLDGVLVEAMARPGVELILGVRGDPDWGPVLVLGLGGIWAEAMRDVRVLPPDLDSATIGKELMRLKGAVLLRGFRGAPALDMQAVAEIVTKLGAFAIAHPEITAIDLNPIVVYASGKGAIALDALIVTR